MTRLKKELLVATLLSSLKSESLTISNAHNKSKQTASPSSGKTEKARDEAA